MRRFRRAGAPAWWVEYRERWNTHCLEKGDDRDAARTKLHGWQRERRSLADWFHDLVREDHGPPVCAYCDGPLREQSPPTIDHFIPDSVCAALALAWPNLYPACFSCNSTFKRTDCNPNAARPDVDPVEEWFDVYPVTGEVAVAHEFRTDARVFAKVADAIELFGLNKGARPEARKRILRRVAKARLAGDDREIEDLRREGIYLFVIEAVLRAVARDGAP
jgi:uncharacterized protein (TIGR02646 family)